MIENINPIFLRIILNSCGLSQREAAEYLNIRHDTLNKALVGKTKCPAGWIQELQLLIDKQKIAAANFWQQVDQMIEQYGIPTKPITCGIPLDDHEARSLGWPCVGAAMQVAALIWLDQPTHKIAIDFVPRGSTPAAAAAADQHDAVLRSPHGEDH